MILLFSVVAFGFDDNPQIANTDLKLTSPYNTQLVIGVSLIIMAVMVHCIVYIIDYFYRDRIRTRLSSVVNRHHDIRKSQLKIMVIDDDPAICKILSTMFASKGHQVHTYPDPNDTPIVKELEGRCPQESRYADAILVDYSMPNMNGLEFLKLLDQRGFGVASSNRAIITAYATNELRHELDQLGVKYFKKPFRLREINKWLEDCSTRVAQAGV